MNVQQEAPGCENLSSLRFNSDGDNCAMGEGGFLGRGQILYCDVESVIWGFKNSQLRASLVAQW